ncbi:hypothetical protein FOPG_16676 [Fusarium oxysporum f. sp. conglutinans race 2 54008]|uniref:Uncharacterized protein n=4 Tax=Fusarium oxysporum TaxID=5507 RepID=A0A8H6GZU0_FUSOX|nr:hypothetical protein FOXB_07456 [Fusarium oxysporum f. sp. conglutinans Fo5176]EXK25085.1 hypothetical protein FOMG_18231 [Fusarium oxysporum f. sp. melonis 26406]EXL67183.1 hypothetical protein FOPG_16676 [Fusarium oxysporum f. sp. conglutinans race 2 54008]KAF6527744.1 hypothetical protein HZS61_008046 [Fusarium oxysporum f. sp. conglutinans]KAI8417158.1 hypothetical protein FOFC_03471 [Fusarium oxysporum]
MPALPPFQAVLFYSAALVHIAIVPKHIYVGATAVTEAIEAIPNQPRYTVAKSIFKTVWDHGNADVLILALLNYKWAKYGPPTLIEERMMLGLSLVAGFYAGWPYFKLGMYSPLVMLWVAPVASTIATILG